MISADNGNAYKLLMLEDLRCIIPLWLELMTEEEIDRWIQAERRHPDHSAATWQTLGLPRKETT